MQSKNFHGDINIRPALGIIERFFDIEGHEGDVLSLVNALIILHRRYVEKDKIKYDLVLNKELLLAMKSMTYIEEPEEEARKKMDDNILTFANLEIQMTESDCGHWVSLS